jgi:uncharacterized membrane protein
MRIEFLVLRLIHILGGIFWLGSGAFTTFFLAPALARSGVNAGQVFGALQARKLFAILPGVAVLTILSGLRLIWIDSAGFDPRYFASATGAAFAIGGAAAVTAFLLSLLVTRPSNVRAGKLGASMATATEGERVRIAAGMTRLQRRASLAGSIAMVLLIFGAAGMAVARVLA